MHFTVYGWSSVLIIALLAVVAETKEIPQTFYTNVAGQVISGPVQGVEKDKVIFDGRAYSLQIFPKQERMRILRAAKVPLPQKRDTEKERKDLFYQNLLQRQDALEQAGVISHEEAEHQRGLIRKAWQMPSRKIN